MLAAFTTYENWKRATNVREHLPAAGDLISHPLASSAKAIDVFKMDVARRSAETAEKRKSSIEDVQKRTTYRRAHGLEGEDSQGMGGWTAQDEQAAHGLVLNDDGPNITDPSKPASIANVSTANHLGNAEDLYVHSETKRRPMKKWLGIW